MYSELKIVWKYMYILKKEMHVMFVFCYFYAFEPIFLSEINISFLRLMKALKKSILIGSITNFSLQPLNALEVIMWPGVILQISLSFVAFACYNCNIFSRISKSLSTFHIQIMLYFPSWIFLWNWKVHQPILSSYVLL